LNNRFKVFVKQAREFLMVVKLDVAGEL